MENAILPLQHLRQLLQMEHDAEKEEYRTQTERMSVARKVAPRHLLVAAHRGPNLLQFPQPTGD